MFDSISFQSWEVMGTYADCFGGRGDLCTCGDGVRPADGEVSLLGTLDSEVCGSVSSAEPDAECRFGSVGVAAYERTGGRVGLTRIYVV